jgi:hypothetical protein
MAVFDWWLLIVGLVVGAGLVWLVLADSSRREAEILEEELPIEAAWISATLADEGVTIDAATSERILRLHRTYLESLPPDEVAPGDALASEAKETTSGTPVGSGRDAGRPPTTSAPGPAESGHGVRRDVLPARDR